MPTNEPTLTDELAPRQCGRCREMFAGDPDQPANAALPAWWVCPQCRAVLFGADSKG